MIRAFLIAAFCLLLTVSARANDRILDIQSFKTDKGINVWLVEDHSLPVIAMAFAFGAGAEQADSQTQGLAQLLSNTLDEGAGDITAKDFQASLRDHAIDLSFRSGRDEFSGTVRTLVRHKDKAFSLLKLALEKPRFDPEAVERMRKANLSRIRSSMGDADWIASRLMYDAIYKGHPYGLNSGGTMATMQAFKPSDLRAEWKRIAARERLFVGLAGDITVEEAKSRIDEIFGFLPASAPLKPVAEAVMPKAGKPVYFSKEMPQTIISLAWNGIGVNDPDYYAATVMDYIFGGGGFTSRLMTEIREKRGLTYGISSDLMNNDHGNRYVVSASMQPQNVATAIGLVKTIADNLKTIDVTADELSAAKHYLVGSLPLSLSSSARIAGTLAGLQLDNRPVTALDDYRAKIEAVTPADIKRVASRIFAQDPVIVMVGGAPDGMDFETVTRIPNTEKPEKQ